ncbi:MAG: NAD(P)H-hydrate dehydratase, partial [Phycisphaerales bacterium]|nr:NAD(P)H-hydrate dehydratase [Phycisphaerales bacterium]
PLLDARPIDGHKGTFGTVGVIGGSAGNPGGPNELQPRMIGAPALVAMGANAAGCGLVKIGAPEPILSAILTLAPMATGFPIGITPNNQLIEADALSVLDRLASESDTIVIGPGLGIGKAIEQLVLSAVSMQEPRRCRSLIVDADAINALCNTDNFVDQFQVPAVVTPHPGEAQRLLDALGLDGTPAGPPEQRAIVCNTLADALGCIVVLKGMGTVVSDGQRCWTCSHGHPCLATGGTGDILAGMIGSLAAQCVDNPNVDLFISTCIAVDAHAKSGERWAAKMGASSGLNPQILGSLIPAEIQQNRRST